MAHMNFYWGIITSINSIALSLWIGSLFFYCLSVRSSVGLLDKTLKSSVLLQNLKRIYQLNGFNAFAILICQLILFIHHYFDKTVNWSGYAAIITTILMIILHLYSFTSAYQKANRSIRPKTDLYNKICNIFKLIIFLGIIDILLLNF